MHICVCTYRHIWLFKHENTYFEYENWRNSTNHDISKMQNEKVLDSENIN